jgi:hypothetical protein
MIMPFGKHRGKRLENIPLPYLHWVLGNCANVSPVLRAEIKRAIQEPDDPQPLALPGIVSRWYRQLSREFHPDVRGSHEAMKAINRANELLCELAGVAR